MYGQLGRMDLVEFEDFARFKVHVRWKQLGNIEAEVRKIVRLEKFYNNSTFI